MITPHLRVGASNDNAALFNGDTLIAEFPMQPGENGKYEVAKWLQLFKDAASLNRYQIIDRLNFIKGNIIAGESESAVNQVGELIDLLVNDL